MMRANAILRAAFLISAALFLNFSIAGRALGQDVGGDVGGASIFRARNPETKKKPGDHHHAVGDQQTRNENGSESRSCGTNRRPA
jgi:hypothetical protein